MIKEHNERYDAGQETFSLVINKFADLDNIEFKHLYTGKKPRSQRKEIVNLEQTSKCNGTVTIVDNLPTSWTWRDKAVGEVRNQGMCGSCWAFSAIGGLEGLNALKTGSVLTYSPQQLVDCASAYDNEGCNGGDMDTALWYVKDYGIALDSKYPYKGRDQQCGYSSSMKAFEIKDCAEVAANKTLALQSAVVKQPVSISVEADQTSFQFYNKGVMNKKCGLDLDHGIVLTGYGSLDGNDYWECKNSWGPSWGMKGYIMIARDNKDGPGLCGILMENTVPQ